MSDSATPRSESSRPTPLTDWPPLPDRPAASHKGTFGHVLVIAGSRGMSGAAALSGLGALRGGAGLVTIAVPEGIQEIVAGFDPSYMTWGLPETEAGQISAEAIGVLLERISKFDAVVCGPGWGQSSELKAVLQWLMRTIAAPLLIDADALNLLAANQTLFRSSVGPRVLTPHPGEFSRLTGRSITEIQERRLESAWEFAAQHRVVLVLKGAGTVITDGQQIAVNTTGNSGLSTGGTGDVLSGLTGALLGQKLEPFAAARLAAHLHGLAGDLAAEELSQPGLIASDLPGYIAQAWRERELRNAPLTSVDA